MFTCHNDFEWLHCTLSFRLHRNMMEFECLYAAVALSPFLDESKEQRLVAASCVFPRNAMLSSPPSILICVLLQVRVHVYHGRMRTLVRATILRLMCLHAFIFRLKLTIRYC